MAIGFSRFFFVVKMKFSHEAIRGILVTFSNTFMEDKMTKWNEPHTLPRIQEDIEKSRKDKRG